MAPELTFSGRIEKRAQLQDIRKFLGMRFNIPESLYESIQVVLKEYQKWTDHVAHTPMDTYTRLNERRDELESIEWRLHVICDVPPASHAKEVTVHFVPMPPLGRDLFEPVCACCVLRVGKCVH